MNRFRVLMLTAKFWPTVGGAQNHVFEVSQALVRLRFDVTVVAEKNPSTLPFSERAGKVRIYRAPIRSCKLLLLPAYVLISLIVQCRFRADIVHAHFAVPCGLIGVLVSKIFRVPLVITVHGIDIIKASSIGYGIRLNPAIDRLTRRVLREADHIIACSEFVRKLVVECGVNLAKTSVIPNGTSDLERKASLTKSKEWARQKLGFPSNSFIMFAARRLERKNGIEYLIRATCILKRESPKFHVVIAGEGPLRNSLEKLSIQLGLRSEITFLGEVDKEKLELLYLASDVVVLPSVVEAFGLPVIEAMAFHRPIIAFNSGGPAEVVEREATGIIVEEMNELALAKAISNLASQPTLLERFQANSSMSVHAYAWERIAERTKAVYADVLACRSDRVRFPS